MAKYKSTSTGYGYRLAGLLLGVLLMMIVSGAQAQGPGTSGLENTPNGPDNSSNGVPIDGGLGLLLAAGAGYGVKKIRDFRQGIKSK